MIQASLATGGIAGPARTDPDAHIADGGTASGIRGLRKQAGIAVGVILGLTTDPKSDTICGSHLWSGQTLDLDAVGDVVESLEDTIAAPSDSGGFGREFEDRIVAMNGAGTLNAASDHPDPKLDAEASPMA